MTRPCAAAELRASNNSGFRVSPSLERIGLLDMTRSDERVALFKMPLLRGNKMTNRAHLVVAPGPQFRFRYRPSPRSTLCVTDLKLACSF